MTSRSFAGRQGLFLPLDDGKPPVAGQKARDLPLHTPAGAHKRKEATFRLPLRAENETRILFCNCLIISHLQANRMKSGVK